VYAATYGPFVGINAVNYKHRMINLPDWDVDHDWISWQLLSSDKTWYITRNKSHQFYYRRSTEQNFSLASYANDSLFNILPPMYMEEDPTGNIWFGGHGASRFDTRNQKFDLLLNSFPKIKTVRKEVNGIAFDQSGKVYFGLAENGLAIYDPSGKNYDHVTRANGLPDNTIRAIFLHRNKVWLGTERGLASYDIATRKTESFGVADDMPDGDFTAYSFYYDSIHDQLYGGFNNAIVRFNPDSLAKNNSPPEFFVENIQIPGLKTIHRPEGQLYLPYKHNNIVVNLASINFEDAYQQQFAYRLRKTGDEPWQVIGSQRNIIFSNLSPGEYVLELKVFINNNSWSAQVKQIKVIVHPPFWQKAWFIVLCSVLLITTVTLLVRLRIKNIRQKANMNTQLAELEMKGLHAQMNPHFIFNSLNSIKEMILEDEKQNASRYLSKFAQLIRTSLDHSKQTFISVQQCIDHLQQYLEMEKIRFEDFTYSIEVSPELPAEHLLMPPMLIQPLVENAIWHGLHPKAGNKKLSIKFFTADLILIAEIEDNGIGIVQSRQNKMDSRPTHRSFGIANVRERLDVLNEKYNMNCSLNIVDKQSLQADNETGTIVRLELTIINQFA
ncbi:MAG TPA: histidine kinase, partial [Chitinophagaceae bacterium]